MPAGVQGEMIKITIPVNSNGDFGTSATAYVGSSSSGISASCTGTQAAQVGVQYSGYLTTVSGQTYPFTVTASS